MAIDYAILGQRIKKLRKDRDITQYALAEKLNVSTVYLSRIESGQTKINLDRLSQICEILGVTEGYVINGSATSSKKYLTNEFSDILGKCSKEKQKLIYEIAKVIADQDNEE